MNAKGILDASVWFFTLGAVVVVCTSDDAIEVINNMGDLTDVPFYELPAAVVAGWMAKLEHLVFPLCQLHQIVLISPKTRRSRTRTANSSCAPPPPFEILDDPPITHGHGHDEDNVPPCSSSVTLEFVADTDRVYVFPA